MLSCKTVILPFIYVFLLGISIEFSVKNIFNSFIKKELVYDKCDSENSDSEKKEEGKDAKITLEIAQVINHHEISFQKSPFNFYFKLSRYPSIFLEDHFPPPDFLS